MNKKTFIELFIQAREESIGSNSNSQTDEDDVYDTYIDLVKQMSDSNTARTHMERMSEMTTSERLRWRMCLSEQGIEMTPRQVDEYIVILDLALFFNDFDD